MAILLQCSMHIKVLYLQDNGNINHNYKIKLDIQQLFLSPIFVNKFHKNNGSIAQHYMIKMEIQLHYYC